MAIIDFGLGPSDDDWSFSSDSTSNTLFATQLSEVLPLIEAAESAAQRGAYVVLMLSYEAAPVFDPALSTHEATSFPLAWATVVSPNDKKSPDQEQSYSATAWTPQVSRDEYNRAILRIQDLIAAGDTYQVNYSFPLRSVFSGDGFSWYRSLSLAQGAKYCAYLDIGRYQILSLSPELFFERKGNSVRTRPMKGTIRRGRFLEEDKLLAATLKNSPKDQAENVMIVDLLRNDLGKVSIPGSVEVTSLYELERFETVWQMTSTVKSTLRDNISLVELLGALFPCGSITGAPKIRTMEIIRELEPHPRGIYTGAIGLLRPGGDCIFNVAIRTVVVDSETGMATFGVGGGITIDSTADREYEECLVKAKFLNTPRQTFDLFESLLLEDAEYFLLERHLERLRNSADFFGFEYSEIDIASRLDQLKRMHNDGSWKVRVVAAKQGALSTQAAPIEPGVEKVLKVGLATKAVDSNDRMLFHKTTQRSFYESQLKQQPECNDVIFFNERGEVTESTIANVVVELNGRLVTPPVSAGLLAGTFRDQLIADEQIEERTITVDELRAAKKIFLINSVRKWMKTVLYER